jgi:ABC-type sugar transport system permease subunit
MKNFFIFMFVLLSLRIAYYMVVAFIPKTAFVDLTNDGIFNLALLIPYVTEIIFNMVIFYFNFLQND